MAFYLVYSMNAKVINMSLTISVTGKIPGVRQNPLDNSLEKAKFILAFIRIQRKHFFWGRGGPYDAFNEGWCVEDTIESYQKYQMAF